MTEKPDVLPPETGAQSTLPSEGEVVPKEFHPGQEPETPLSHSSPGNPEEISRIRVDDQDRMAFRVGVNILTLVLIGVGVYLLWRQFFAGS